MNDFCLLWFMKWLMFWIQQLQQPFIQNSEKVGRSILRHLKEAQRGEDEKEQRQQRSKKKMRKQRQKKKWQEEMEDKEEEK